MYIDSLCVWAGLRRRGRALPFITRSVLVAVNHAAPISLTM